MAQELTFRGRLVAQFTDYAEFKTYVFANMDATTKEEKYVMCTQFPNWQQNYIGVGDIGYVTIRSVVAGQDTWFDGTQHVPYKNTGIHFLKFVPEAPEAEDVVLDLGL